MRRMGVAGLVLIVLAAALGSAVVLAGRVAWPRLRRPAAGEVHD
jgi:hypothetical protein